MRRRCTALTVLFLAAAFQNMGCEPVPDIRFVSDDAGGEPAGPDGGTPNDGAPASDAGGCPGLQPSGATCCGKQWCIGCTQAQCGECDGQPCATGELCCAKPGTVQCKTKCP